MEVIVSDWNSNRFGAGVGSLYVAAQLVGAIFAGALYRWFWVQRRTLGSVTVQSGAAAE